MKIALTIICLVCKVQSALSNDNNIDDIDEDDRYIFDFLWFPEKYYISIKEIFKGWNVFYGEAKMEGMTTKETNYLYLHSKVRLVGGSLQVNGVSSEINVKKAVSNTTNDILTLYLDKTLALHQYFTLTLLFYGALTTNYDPVYLIEEINGHNLSRPTLATEFQPFGARSAFPCIDLPRLKANIQIQIASNKEYTVLSNMPLKTDTQNNQIRNHVFYQTPKMSTYIVAFIMFGKDIQCEMLPEENQFCSFSKEKEHFKDHLSVIPIIRNSVANFTNIPYMLPKLDQIVIGKKEAVGMESWGLITWRNNLFLSKDLKTLKDKLYLFEFVAHEIAHQWFGNLVTCKFWCYIWLNEGVVTYVQNLIVDKIFPESKTLEFFVVDEMWDPMLVEILQPITLVNKKYCSEENKPQLIMSYSFYKKGASILHMVAKTIMPTGKFQQALQNYLRTFQYSTVVEKDLWLEMEMNIDRSILRDLYKENSLEYYMKTWTHNQGYPLVFVQRNSSKIYVRQERFTEKNKSRTACGQSDYWWIPITYTISSKPNFRDTSVKQWIKPTCMYEELRDVHILQDDWIILNIQHAGYYKVMYDPRTYELLTHHLIENDINVIHPLNRAQIINDAFDLAFQKYIDIDVPLNLTKYMSKETHFAPFHAALVHFKKLLKEHREIPSTHSIHNYIKKIISVAYDRVTSTNFSINDIANYRYKIEIVDMACELKFPKCVQQALLLANAVIKGEKSEVSIIPELRTTLWCSAIRSNNQTIPDYLLKKLNSPSTSQLLTKVYSNALACSKNRNVLYKFIDWVFNSGNQDGFTTLIFNLAPKDSKCVIMNYITGNIDKLITRHGWQNVANRLLKLSLHTKTPICVILMRQFAKERGFVVLPKFDEKKNVTAYRWFQSQDSKYFLSDLPIPKDEGSLDNNSFLKQRGIDFFKIPSETSSE
ncbi:aminopeptidase N-like [Cimex lectularius]|uniref:Aminopeptidase n=1 Tax=Cimex lectularius TaxID=79782 RepID=A0A8I6RY70_CIMLE|nr:aminopeptidase N-like [Cimex lectularius]